MKAGRILEVIRKDGPGTFAYLVKDKCRQKQNEERKYRNYQTAYEGDQKRNPILKSSPLVSVLLKASLNENYKEQSMRSVREQTYGRVEVLNWTEDSLLSEAVREMKGRYLFVLQEGDLFAPDAVLSVMEVIQDQSQDQPLFFYADEDQMEKNGTRSHPDFKPDYSPDTLLSWNYMGHGFAVEKTVLFRAVERLEDMSWKNENWLYELALSCCRLLQPDQIVHIQRVLYHYNRRTFVNELDMATEQDQKRGQQELADWKEKILEKEGKKVVVEQAAEVSHIHYLFESKPKVSVIIPSMDNPQLLGSCLNSIAACTCYESYEVIVVDNGSSDENRKRISAMLEAYETHTVYVYEKMEFNFSKMCNLGAKAASGGYYLFLNDDIEILPIQEEYQRKHAVDWMDILTGQAAQEWCGAVGAKLLFPSTTLIQHIGVVNYETGAAHIYSRSDDTQVLRAQRNRADYNYLCVTGACLMIQREKFEAVGGFSESLAVTFNDVELCMKLQQKGWFQTLRNDVVLYHHESITRGEDARDEVKLRRHLKEREKLFVMQPDYVKRDPFYSPYLTQKCLDATLSADLRMNSCPVEWTTDHSVDCQMGGTVVAALEVCRVTSQLEFRGYIFDEAVKKQNTGKGIVLKSSEKTYYLAAQSVYDPTLAKQLQSDCNLNFASFVCFAARDRVEEGVYQVGICMWHKRHLMKERKQIYWWNQPLILVPGAKEGNKQ